MNINTFFNDFLSEIRLTDNQRSDLRRGHKTLRERLAADKTLSKIIVATFLQGSYKRATAVRPSNGKRADVDVIVVTNLDRNKVTPKQVIEDFIPFLEEHYKGKYTIQDRSIAIELSYVDLDIVITSAPSEVEAEKIYNSRSIQTELSLEEFVPTYQWRMNNLWSDTDLIKGHTTLNESARNAAEWKTEPLWIPDRAVKEWTETHPLEQIRWTREKNSATNTHYVNVVKAVKWMKLEKMSNIKYPKGYPIEHMLGDYCPNGITSVAEGVVTALEGFVAGTAAHRIAGIVPEFADRGVPLHNVWKRISKEDFNAFYDRVKELAEIARLAYDATTLEEQVKYWKQLFGSKFPDPPKEEKTKSQGGFTERSAPTVIGGSRFA